MSKSPTKFSFLREGMREGDLNDLVLPLISCDEYCSVIDSSEAVVMGFYVHEEAAAKDLNRFLQKSAVPLLGTEVSPAPDQHGYFMVFVEMMDNDRLAENLTALLHEMKTLVNIDDWQIRIRTIDGLVPFSAEALTAGLADAKKSTEKKDGDSELTTESMKPAAIEYLQRSALRNAEFIDQLLILEGGEQRYCFEFMGFGEIPKLLRQHRLDEAGERYDLRSIARSNKITCMLGEPWQVSRLNNCLLLHVEGDQRGLLVKGA